MDFKGMFDRRADRMRRALAGRRPIDPVNLNLKLHGYDMARSLAAALPLRENLQPAFVGLGSKPSTQADLESDWAAYWCAALKVPMIYHRKIWEMVYLLQSLHDAGVLGEGRRGLGFGCGREPMASLLASMQNRLTVTDMPEGQARRAWWVGTHQHAAERDQAFYDYLVDYETFDRLVSFMAVDMNAIPAELSGFDFCWSMCAFEHLGTIEKGLAFVENAMATLRPGGTAVHTTEFNFLDDENTLERGATVLFQRRHFEALAERLTRAGHTVAPLDFHVGSKPLDRFIDVPPYPNDYSDAMRRQWGDEAFHLKLMVGDYACTCFGLTVTKAA